MTIYTNKRHVQTEEYLDGVLEESERKRVWKNRNSSMEIGERRGWVQNA